MLSNSLWVLLLLLGFPTGLILAKLCKEELKAWKKRFILIIAVSVLTAIFLSFITFQYRIPIIFTLVYLIITFLVLIWRS